jgi:hypothetical protein
MIKNKYCKQAFWTGHQEIKGLKPSLLSKERINRKRIINKKIFEAQITKKEND